MNSLIRTSLARRACAAVITVATSLGLGILPEPAYAQGVGLSAVEHIAVAPSTYRLEGPGRPTSRTLVLAGLGPSVSFPVRGVLYDVKATVASGDGSATVKGVAELLDGRGQVLLSRELTASATKGAGAALDIRLYASHVREAASLRLSYEALSGTEVSVSNISVDRAVASHAIVEIDFD